MKSDFLRTLVADHPVSTSCVAATIVGMLLGVQLVSFFRSLILTLGKAMFIVLTIVVAVVIWQEFNGKSEAPQPTKAISVAPEKHWIEE